ncbi:hypothetical protein [Streptomyces sp. NPDC056401]|uniref:hypothetical protein n=1 Tax=Streptomyces sp. NPDC056401 TaxID=3345809 RepID=UPI0035E0E480
MPPKQLLIGLADVLLQGVPAPETLVRRQVERVHERDGTLPTALPVRRVWLHAASADNTNALPNYHRRGFRTFKTEEAPGPA